MHDLFVYGTLQHPALLARLLGRVPAMDDATVAGYRAAPMAGRVYPGLVPDDAASAAGKIVHVSDAELAVLDEFEGPEYERVPVIARAGHRDVPCQAWRLVAAARHHAAPGAWSYERFVVEGAAAFLGASEAGARHPGSEG